MNSGRTIIALLGLATFVNGCGGSGSQPLSFHSVTPTNSSAGVTNPQLGLAKWRASMARVHSGHGGISILCIGDSLECGVMAGSSGSDWYQSFPNQLRVLLQKQFGGGYGLGYQPVVAPGNSKTPNFLFDSHAWVQSTEGIVSASSDAAGAQCRWFLPAPASPASGSNNTEGAGVTSTELVYYNRSNASPISCDFSTANTFTTLGQGNPSTIVTPVTNGNGGFAKAPIASNLDPGANFGLTIQRASGANDCWLEGLIQYSGNESSGLTLLNFANGGQMASDYETPEFYNLADSCTSQTGVLPSSYGRLAIFDFAINEALNNVSAATFSAGIGSLADRYINRGCSILYIIPAGIAAASPQAQANFQSLRQAIYQVQSTRSDMCVLDLSTAWGGSLSQIRQFDSGDQIHPNAAGYADIAARCFSLLVSQQSQASVR